jgi:hypothetical protein
LPRKAATGRRHERARPPAESPPVTHIRPRCSGHRYTASWFDDGRLGEIFLSNHHADCHADACAKDAAILTSIALQYGVPLDVLRKALLRDQRGYASTPIGVALDMFAEDLPR